MKFMILVLNMKKAIGSKQPTINQLMDSYDGIICLKITNRIKLVIGPSITQCIMHWSLQIFKMC